MEMMRPRACERAAQFVSLELDGALSNLEEAMLRRHLDWCEHCAAYARDVGGITDLLRNAPLEDFRVPSVPALRQRRASWILKTGSAAAAAAALIVWLGVAVSDTGRAPSPVQASAPKLPRGTQADERFEWSAGLPHTPRFIQLFPGNLRSGSDPIA
jgi:anti-sigma factor RsiW